MNAPRYILTAKQLAAIRVRRLYRYFRANGTNPLNAMKAAKMSSLCN